MSELDIGEHPSLSTDEKQLSFVTTKADAPSVRVHSEVASVTRRILQHPEFTVENRRVVDGSVVAVTGTIPLSCLTVKASPKASDQFSRLVSSGVENGN